jgi:hypothetical protein
MKRKTGREEDLTKLFGSVSRGKILGFLYAFLGQTFYQREIMFETGLSLYAVQSELGNLVALGIVRTERTLNKVYYEINRESPLFRPLRDIFGSISER